mgnify:CR=1 FL=1
MILRRQYFSNMLANIAIYESIVKAIIGINIEMLLQKGLESVVLSKTLDFSDVFGPRQRLWPLREKVS